MTTTERLEEASRLNRERLTKEASDDVMRISDNIDANKARLDARVFEKELLPYIIGEKELEENSTFYEGYKNLAGSWYGGIELIDTTGKVIITTPPLINRIENDLSVNTSVIEDIIRGTVNNNNGHRYAKALHDLTDQSTSKTLKSDWDNFAKELRHLLNIEIKVDEVKTNEDKTVDSINEIDDDFAY